MLLCWKASTDPRHFEPALHDVSCTPTPSNCVHVLTKQSLLLAYRHSCSAQDHPDVAVLPQQLSRQDSSNLEAAQLTPPQPQLEAVAGAMATAEHVTRRFSQTITTALASGPPSPHRPATDLPPAAAFAAAAPLSGPRLSLETAPPGAALAAAAAASAQQELAALGHVPNEVFVRTSSGRIVVLRPGPSQQDGQPGSPQILQLPGAPQWHDLAFLPAQGANGFAQHNGSGFLLTDESRFNSLIPGLDTTLLLSSSGGGTNGAPLTAAAAAAAFGSTVGLDMLVEPAEGLHGPAVGGAQLMHVGGGEEGKQQ